MKKGVMISIIIIYFIFSIQKDEFLPYMYSIVNSTHPFNASNTHKLSFPILLSLPGINRLLVIYIPQANLL